MITAPEPIPTFHRALLDALGVDYFAPGIADINLWHDFLWFLDTLKDSAGGPLTDKDIYAVVRLMRQENRDKRTGWSLRFARILKEPESFRDLVLQSRKQKRDRPPVRTVSVPTGDGASVMIERDPAATADAKPLREFIEKMKGPDHAKNKETDSRA